jgi:hypothetical protein
MSLSTEYPERQRRTVGLVAVKGKVQTVGVLKVLVATEHLAGLAKAALFPMTAIATVTDINPTLWNCNKYLTTALGDCAPVREGEETSIDAIGDMSIYVSSEIDRVTFSRCDTLW